MKNINCLIVEDEPLATEILVDYVKQVPFLNLAATCPDVLYASQFLRTGTIDLMFLDIHLPKIKGLDFLRTLNNSPQVIITTAYHEYALQGYELNILDYLVKPIEFKRFLVAVNKFRSIDSPSIPENAGDFFINVDKKKVKIRVDEMLYAESLREYVRIYSATKSWITKLSISELEHTLGKQKFLRTHRSFLVALDKIETYTSTEIELIGGKSIPIGRTFLDEVVEALERKK
jgi:DNA-binding LytR/AlgR family response regulator